MKRSGRRSPQAVDNHLSRTVPTHNADPSRTQDNVWLVGGPGSVAVSIDAVLDKAAIDLDALRVDATIANDLVLSISPEWFRPDDPDAAGEWRADRLATFRSEAESFLREHFGSRLASAVLHLDESTPHVQAIIVPVMKRAGGGYRLSGKDCFNPARLEALQEAWQKRLTPHGVGPRKKGSTAEHTTIKDYYSALEAAPAVPPILPPAPPPMRALLPGGSATMTEWQGQEVAKVARRQKPLAAAAAKGMLYEAERASADSLRAHVQEQTRRMAELREQLSRLATDLALTKEQIARLRGVPVADVAVALGYAGEIGKRENGIDLVKRVTGFSFEEATRWMSLSFSPAAAGAAVAHQAAAVALTVDEVPLTKADQVKAAAVRKQLDALDARGYRVTVMHGRDDGTRYGVNLCKQGEQPEILWTKDDVLFHIPRLTAENARGGNVFLTPVDPMVHFALIDDLSADNLAAFKGLGYAPATVVQTSPGSHQAVVKVLRNGVPDAAVNEWFKSTNRELGDERITGLAHPMRLAGFQNRKAKHQRPDGHYPFVRLLEAARGFCGRARVVIADMARQMRATPPTASVGHHKP
jgi:hypothetical protein